MHKPIATLLDRTKSSTIDTLLLILIAFCMADLLGWFDEVAAWVKALLFLMLVLYEPICISLGATYGNIKMNIRVRRSSNESKKLNIFRSLLRFTIKLLLGWLSYVSIFKNPRKRALHDLISGATVIEV